MVVSTVLTASKTVEVVVFTASHAVEMPVLMASSAVEMTPFIASHAVVMISLQFSQIKVNGRAIICPAAETTSTIS